MSRTESWRLDGSYKDDAEVAKLMAAYRQWTKTKGLEAAREAAAVAGATPYAGAEACGACHEAQHANWKTTRHAHAWESLLNDPDGGAEDPECISCHVSGFLQPGGPGRIEDLEKFRGVQCESCHMPVKDHPGGRKFGKVSEEQCRTCHSETRDPDFDFKSYLKPATCVTPKTPGDDRPHR
ncbi:MAG: hypothetical protein HYY18_09965 [Planctomycetes bacterium]|nr:hypothetical protein [Planctomycetota bacterium]